ncbi:MAG: NUDIX hydrolase [Actinobacteria bacterium]|nr:NUDIX hydrolase [Actinomycetota bacterium]
MSERVPLRMPEHLIARAQSLVGVSPEGAAQEAPDWQPPPLRHAATIVLVRKSPVEGGEHRIELYLQRRVSTMAFAAGMYVFPGGAVDPIDIAKADRWLAAQPGDAALPDFARWPADAIGEDTLAARFAAVRETSEEAGVDLGSEIAVRMPYIAHWATPAVEDRRYDTRFYAVALDSSQQTSQTSGESDRHVWVSPKVALGQYSRGEMLMLPPTVAVLTAFDQAINARPTAISREVIDGLGREPVVPLMPHPVADPTRPGGLGWNLVDVRTEAEVAANAFAPAGSESGGVHTSLVDRHGRPS